MKNDFPRILTLLRKEKGLSQKAAAEKLGISQALLSHYEKGIRECGLDFLLAVADEYGVSTDYLLGRTTDRQGAQMTAEEMPEYDGSGEKNFKGSMLATLNKKLIINTVSIIFDQLDALRVKDLTTEVGAYLSLALYKVFRALYTSNPANPRDMFAVRQVVAQGLSGAAMHTSESYIGALCGGEQVGDMKPMAQEQAPELSPEKVSESYPALASSLFSVIGTAEARMGAKPKK